MSDPEGRQDRRMIRFVIGGCFLVLLAAGVVGYFAGREYLHTRSPARSVERHLQSINRGNHQLAYSDFADGFQHETSTSDFRKMLDSYSDSLPYRKLEFQRVNVANGSAEIDGVLTGKNWAIIPFHYELLYQNGKWKILDFEWSPPGKQLQT